MWPHGVALWQPNKCQSAPAKPLYHTFAVALRGHTGGGGGYCSDLFKADKCFTKSFYFDNGFIIIFPVGADCQSQRRIQGQQTHFVLKFSAAFGVICRAQTSLNLTRGLNISQARKRQLKAPYYFPLFSLQTGRNLWQSPSNYHVKHLDSDLEKHVTTAGFNIFFISFCNKHINNKL